MFEWEHLSISLCWSKGWKFEPVKNGLDFFNSGLYEICSCFSISGGAQFCRYELGENVLAVTNSTLVAAVFILPFCVVTILSYHSKKLGIMHKWRYLEHMIISIRSCNKGIAFPSHTTGICIEGLISDKWGLINVKRHLYKLCYTIMLAFSNDVFQLWNLGFWRQNLHSLREYIHSQTIPHPSSLSHLRLATVHRCRKKQ